MINATRGIFHPDWFYRARPVVESAMITAMDIWAPTGTESHWTPGGGENNDQYELIWRGFGRFQPNKDWRARTRETANELTAVHAVRIQLPIGQNHFGATLDVNGDVVTYGADPVFEKDQRVHVTGPVVTGSEGLVEYPLTVRNALNSGNQWLYNLLCDVATKADG